MCFC
jgi:chromosome segregation ATPase